MSVVSYPCSFNSRTYVLLEIIKERYSLFYSRIKHRSVRDLVKPDLVGSFALPGGTLTSLAPAGFLKSPWSILFLPGEQFSFPGDAC